MKFYANDNNKFEFDLTFFTGFFFVLVAQAVEANGERESKQRYFILLPASRCFSGVLSMYSTYAIPDVILYSYAMEQSLFINLNFVNNQKHKLNAVRSKTFALLSNADVRRQLGVCPSSDQEVLQENNTINQ